jgi:hypothetical protein
MCTRPVPQYSADDQPPLTPDSSTRTATPVPAAYVTRSPVIHARAAVLPTFSRCRRAAVPPCRRAGGAPQLLASHCSVSGTPPRPSRGARRGSHRVPLTDQRKQPASPSSSARSTQNHLPQRPGVGAARCRQSRRGPGTAAHWPSSRADRAAIPHVQDMRAGYPRSSGVSWRQMLLKTTPRMGSSAIVIACSRPISSSIPPMRWASEPM